MFLYLLDIFERGNSKRSSATSFASPEGIKIMMSLAECITCSSLASFEEIKLIAIVI